MAAETLGVVVLLGAGLLAGALFAVERAVVPFFASLPADRYVPTLTFLDGRFDPLMPWLARVVVAVGVAATVITSSTPARVLFAAGIVTTVGVGVVSEVVNVALNRRIRVWDPSAPPTSWEADRTRWARGNRLRLAFAVGALLADAAALAAL